ncbi:helix-turn-helix domain-containing protein [Tenacibaculum ascidiaceicola]|uniref:helix-turn-helix domain-containing protein n=1 Tax=Tenacibaculum ascidiaceicola TaxID=1699411 RepID=UPI003CE48970
MKKVFVLLLVIGLSLKVYSQDPTLQDTLLQKSFHELADLFYASKPDTLKAITYSKAIFEKAIKEKDTLRMMSGKHLLADILNNEDIYLNFCDSLIDITKINPSKNYPATAHYNKSIFYFHKGENNNALKELTQSRKYLRKNDSLKYLLLTQLALIESSVGKVYKALTTYKKIYTYAKQKKYLKYENFSTLPLNIASVYKKINKIDSAYFYINEASKLYKRKNDSISLGYSFYMLGNIEEKKKDHKKSINSYKKSISSILSDENYKILIQVYSHIGIQYDLLGDKKRALKYHLKADSLSTIKKIYSKGIEKTHQFLYEKNKDNKNLKKQLLYLNKLIEVKEFKLEEKNKINKTLTEKYDIPNLLAEKKQVIEKLENEVQESRRTKIIYIFLLVVLLASIGYQIKRKRVYKKRFAALMKQNEATKTKEIEKNITQATSKHELSDDTVTTLMEGLEMFETHEDFLNSKINLQLLADRLDTNTSYLSKVINQYKNTSFSNYVNQLRIEYAVEKLKNDTLWRKYTVKAIAQEVGFKNAESFSKAFYKFTGIKPSYFIKELEKNRN